VLPQVVPMQPTLVREPFHRDGRVYEEKFGGVIVVPVPGLREQPLHGLKEVGM
jgi:hypothetical protein